MKSSFMAGCTLGLIACAPAGLANLVISEILFNEVGSDTAGEFIEIYNNGTEAIDLTGYKIGDEETALSTGSTEAMFQFAAGSSIAAGEVQVISIVASVFETTYGFKPTYEIGSASSDDAAVPNLTVYAAWDPDGGTINLSNSNELLLILDPADSLVDTANWGNTFYFDPGLALPSGDGQSYFRINSNVDTDTAADWQLTASAPAGASWSSRSTPGTVTVPEPATAALIGLGSLLMISRRRSA